VFVSGIDPGTVPVSLVSQPTLAGSFVYRYVSGIKRERRIGLIDDGQCLYHRQPRLVTGSGNASWNVDPGTDSFAGRSFLLLVGALLVGAWTGTAQTRAQNNETLTPARPPGSKPYGRFLDAFHDMFVCYR
jgi:hypothetical protein